MVDKAVDNHPAKMWRTLVFMSLTRQIVPFDILDILQTISPPFILCASLSSFCPHCPSPPTATAENLVPNQIPWLSPLLSHDIFWNPELLSTKHSTYCVTAYSTHRIITRQLWCSALEQINPRLLFQVTCVSSHRVLTRLTQDSAFPFRPAGRWYCVLWNDRWLV